MRLLLTSMNLKAVPVIAAAALAGSLLAGCGSSWDIRDGDVLVVGCAKSYFYADADGDGWGDPDSEPEILCDADVARGLTASNGRDCNDDSESITGRIGITCPAKILLPLDDVEPAHAGVLFNQNEFTFLYGTDTRVALASRAAEGCTDWGSDDSLDTEGLRTGQLATFGSQPELAAVLEAIRTEVETNGSGVYAGFVGIHWEGANHYTGAWSFIDDSDDGLIQTGLNWCDAEPMPADFFPQLNGGDGNSPGVPAHVDAINKDLGQIRLALVLQENGDFCLGLPGDIIPDDVLVDIEAGDLSDPYVADLARYQFGEAQLVCSRLKPDPANYVRYVEEGTSTE